MKSMRRLLTLLLPLLLWAVATAAGFDGPYTKRFALVAHEKMTLEVTILGSVENKFEISFTGGPLSAVCKDKLSMAVLSIPAGKTSPLTFTLNKPAVGKSATVTLLLELTAGNAPVNGTVKRIVVPDPKLIQLEQAAAASQKARDTTLPAVVLARCAALQQEQASKDTASTLQAVQTARATFQKDHQSLAKLLEDAETRARIAALNVVKPEVKPAGSTTPRVAPPIISLLSPPAVMDGEEVIIRGTNFANGDTVYFKRYGTTVQSPNTRVISPTEIRAKTTSWDSTTNVDGEIQINTPASDRFTKRLIVFRANRPTIVSVTPDPAVSSGTLTIFATGIDDNRRGEVLILDGQRTAKATVNTWSLTDGITVTLPTTSVNDPNTLIPFRNPKTVTVNVNVRGWIAARNITIRPEYEVRPYPLHRACLSGGVMVPINERAADVHNFCSYEPPQPDTTAADYTFDGWKISDDLKNVVAWHGGFYYPTDEFTGTDSWTIRDTRISNWGWSMIDIQVHGFIVPTATNGEGKILVTTNHVEINGATVAIDWLSKRRDPSNKYTRPHLSYKVYFLMTGPKGTYPE